jgi:hypothetical protein
VTLLDIEGEMFGQAEMALGASWVRVDSHDGFEPVGDLAGAHQEGSITTLAMQTITFCKGTFTYK